MATKVNRSAGTSLPGPEPPALTEALAIFEQSLLARSPRTRATYASGLRRFVEYLETRGLAPSSPVAEVSGRGVAEDYHTWLVRQHGRERRPTVVTYLAALRAFLRFLDRRGWLSPESSYEQVRGRLAEVLGRGQYRTPRIDRRLPLVVLYADRLPLPPAREDGAGRLTLLRDRALLHVLFSSGMRREEASRLDRHDLEDGWQAEALISGKGDKERVVFFDEETLARVREYLAERTDSYSPLFLRHDRARGRPGPGGMRYRLSPQSIWIIVKRYAAQAGVQATPHAFRHTKASVLLNRGAKLSEVQDLLGHASPETTKRIYAHYEVAHLREAFDRFSASPSELVADLADSARSSVIPADGAGQDT